MPPQEQPVRGRVELPSNESMLPTLSRATQQNYAHLRQSAFEVAKERPDLDTRVYTQYMQDFISAAAQAERDINAEINAARKANPKMNWVQLREVTDRANRKAETEYGYFLDKFSKSTVPKYGVEGEEAWKELHNKMHGPSIIGAATSQIYDKKKGGMQWGGIVGLILGGLMATQLTGGLMTGELVPILATVGTAFLGAWLGNKAADGIGNMLKPDPTPAPAPAPARAPERSAAPAAEPQKPLSPEVMAQAEEAVKSPPAGSTTSAPAPNNPSSKIRR